jgi:hypothetical protein
MSLNLTRSVRLVYHILTFCVNAEVQTATDLAGVLAAFVSSRAQVGFHDWLCVTPHAALQVPHGYGHLHQHWADRPAVRQCAPPCKQHEDEKLSVIQY